MNERIRSPLAVLRIDQMGRTKDREWYRFANADKDEADVYIYDVIGESWFGGVTANEFVRELRDVRAGRINLHVNSPGGDIWDATAIRNALIQHPASIHTFIDGIAASAASWVALAGEHVVMAKHATMMIHDPLSIVVGNAETMRKEAEVLDMYGDEIADMYAEKAGGSRQEWRDRMREETWYTDREAVDAGLADEIAGQTAASNSFDASFLNIFKNTPAGLLKPGSKNTNEAPTKRDAERALRDVGFSRDAAKALVSNGWNGPDDDPREAAALGELLEAIRAAT